MLNEATRNFIHQHLEDDVRQLALQGGKNPEVDLPLALEQIAGRQKARTKIPSWAAIDSILYPPHLSMEQCSSEPTAKYKAKMAGEGDLFVDLTTGFGVDAAFISKGFSKAICIECQEQLCSIISANFKQLGLTHVQVICGDATEYLNTMPHADLLMIDPARRDEHGARTFGIADCTPNVLEMMDEMTKKADRIIIKLSPMLDWRKAVSDIESENHHVSCVHIVSVNNDCKELLIEVRGASKEVKSSMSVVCVNLLSDGREERFEFDALAPQSATPTSFPTNPIFLYEPNASIMKAGCFGLLSERFSLSQLDSNSHLFVSETEVQDFPGRCFVINQITTMNKRDLKDVLTSISRANIAVRNFPMTVAELRKRLRLQDGGDVYIFATTVANQGHRLFICRKKS